MRVKAGNQLSQDVQTLDFGSGVSLTETNGDVAVTSSASQPVLVPAPSGDVTGATDTAALQAAITSALAKGAKLISACDGLTPYYTNAALNILPPANSPDGYAYMDWEHHGYPKASIVWVGANNGTMIHAEGWKRSYIDGVKLGVTDGTTGVVGWDIDVTVANPSTSFLTWKNCHVNLGSGTSNGGYRLGHTNGGAADISFFDWVNCSVIGGNGSAVVVGQYGWSVESSNALNLNWRGGSGQFLTKQVTDVSTAGAGSAIGNSALSFYGFGSSHNTTDFEFSSPGAHLISGGRFENGTTFLNVPSGSGHVSVKCSAVELGAYAAGAVFNFLKPGTLEWDDCFAYGTTYTSAFFTLGGFTGTPGQLIVKGGGIRGTDPFYTVSAGTWQIEIGNVAILNATGKGQSAGQYAPRGKNQDAVLNRGIGMVSEPFPLAAGQGVTALTTGTIYAVACGLLGGQTVANVGWFQSAAGASLTLLKTALADKTGKILAVSADSSGALGSSNSYVALAMGTPYVVPADDVYYLCFLAVGTTGPTAMRTFNGTGLGDHLPGSTVYRSPNLSGQTDFPAVASSFAVSTRGSIWPYLYAT